MSRAAALWRSRAAYLVPAAVTAALAAGCSPTVQDQSMTSPVGEGARAVGGHWLTMLSVGSAVFVIVMGLAAMALVRRGRGDHEHAPRRWTLFVAVGGGIIPAVIITGVMVQSVLVMDSVDPGADDGVTVVEVVGHQFWWEVRYPESGVVTANEIHIPTGERVRLEVTTADVIHSLWVPQLSGKMDMVPGQANTMWLSTDEPGLYWGQCAEFCGQQHALMRFAVVAHEPAEFDGWLQAQARPAASDVDEQQGGAAEDPVARGREVFMSSSCVYCHAVAGTEAQGTLGPDLTHLASRETIAAGLLPNNRGNLAGWILDPQSIKPGNLMPGTDLTGEDLQALLAYLESLE